MPRSAAERGSDPLNYVETFQILACEFRIETGSEAIADRLRYVVQHASQDHEITDRVVYQIASQRNDLLLREDGVLIATEHSTKALLETLFKRIQERSFAAVPEYVRIHAASGVYAGSLFLLVGNPHAGKTTLALALLASGMQIVGDELVVLRNGLAAAYPRKFYPREISFDLLPGLKDIAPSLPRVYSADGGRRMAVDPLTFNRPWQIARLAVGTIFYLDPNFGGRTSASPSSKVDMARLVMEQCAPPRSGRSDWIGDLCAMVNGASAYRLAVGELGSAVAVVRDCLRTGPTSG
ncbi:MAG: hypothetical protein ABSH23_10885 [Steroidobacteraceae bacterium]